ncbi:MAG: drug/metabolite transporter (DMT)-like permease [Paracoccaceae bacterium]|jgi:drug/metabolite transporter (DMT)-like permease
MTEPVPASLPVRSPLQAPLLLLVTGTLLTVTIVLSRMAGTDGAPMLWFVSVSMGGGGVVLLAIAALSGQARGVWKILLAYSLGAGIFQATSMATAYLAVAHVGVGYISLAFAFPLLITYVLALAVGMERLVWLRAAGVTVGLAGGLMIAVSKYNGLAGDGAEDQAADTAALGWIIAASAIPFILAGGNLYRTRYWPKGAPPLLLAALMLIFAGVLTASAALTLEGTAAATALWQNPSLLTLTVINIAAFALKFVTYFQLQHVAGPVYLSQIGSVGAAVGIPVAVMYFGETLPDGFTLAVVLIVAGAVLFQLRSSR